MIKTFNAIESVKRWQSYKLKKELKTVDLQSSLPALGYYPTLLLYFTCICLELWAGRTPPSSTYHTLNSPTCCSEFSASWMVLLTLQEREGFPPRFLLNKVLKTSYLSAHILPNKFTRTLKSGKGNNLTCETGWDLLYFNY